MFGPSCSAERLALSCHSAPGHQALRQTIRVLVRVRGRPYWLSKAALYFHREHQLPCEHVIRTPLSSWIPPLVRVRGRPYSKMFWSSQYGCQKVICDAGPGLCYFCSCEVFYASGKLCSVNVGVRPNKYRLAKLAPYKLVQANPWSHGGLLREVLPEEQQKLEDPGKNAGRSAGQHARSSRRRSRRIIQDFKLHSPRRKK